MAMAALSPNSVLATPVQVNPQVRAELQNSAPQVAQEAQKVVKTAQTDTVTISAQALKMADGQDTDTRSVPDKTDERTAEAAQDDTRRNALKAYAAVSSAR